MTAKLLSFPDVNVGDIPKSLRNLADQIERGDYGDCHNIVWVMDEGDSNISVGLMGKSAEPAPLAYFLMGLGMRKMERI